MAKKATKKAKKKASTGLQIKLTRVHQAQAAKCLEKSGKIRLSMKPVSVTRLPKTLSSNTVIMD